MDKITYKSFVGEKMAKIAKIAKNMAARVLVCALLVGITPIFQNCEGKPDEAALLLYVRASSLFNSGKFQEAAALLSDKESAGKVEKFVNALLLRGKSKYFAGDIDGAEKDLKKVLSKRPGQVDASLYTARIMRERGDSNGALAFVETLLARDPNDLRVLRLASELAKDKEDEAASLAYLNRAAEAGSESAYILLERARRRWVSGRTEDALEDLSGAKALSGKESPLFRVIDNLEKTIVKSKNRAAENEPVKIGAKIEGAGAPVSATASAGASK